MSFGSFKNNVTYKLFVHKQIIYLIYIYIILFSYIFFMITLFIYIILRPFSISFPFL